MARLSGLVLLLAALALHLKGMAFYCLVGLGSLLLLCPSAFSLLLKLGGLLFIALVLLSPPLRSSVLDLLSGLLKELSRWLEVGR